MEAHMNENVDDLRDRALDRLTTAYAGGSISLEEYERRAQAIQRSYAPPDIESQVADLQAAAPRTAAPNASMPEPAGTLRNAPSAARNGNPAGRRRQEAPITPASPEELRIEVRHGSPEFALCVMGERSFSGDWLNSDQATTLTLMGSTTFDLRNTALPPGRLRIEALAVMGEVRILVPQGLPVRMTAFPFMGEAKIHGSVEQRIDRDGPWVEVSGMALMGSIVVKAP
jgi:hypothetical protein